MEPTSNLVQSGLSRLNIALETAARGTRIAAAGDFSSAARGARRAINHLLGERIKIDKRAIYTSSETKLRATARRAYQQKHQTVGARAIYLAYLCTHLQGKQASTFLPAFPPFALFICISALRT